MNTKKILIGVGIIAVLGLVYYFMTGGTNSNQSPTAPVSTTVQGGSNSTSTDATSQATNNQPISSVKAQSSGPLSVRLVLPAIVTLTESGFSPSSITIKKGDTILFINKSTKKMWVASDPFPDHSGYSGTTLSAHCPDTSSVAFDQCSLGDSYSFTFTKIGTWNYHNNGIGDAGVVIVQ